jgi:hypothetical protein
MLLPVRIEETRKRRRRRVALSPWRICQRIWPVGDGVDNKDKICCADCRWPVLALHSAGEWHIHEPLRSVGDGVDNKEVATTPLLSSPKIQVTSHALTARGS